MGISYTPTIYILYIHIYLRERRWASCRCVCVSVYLSVCVYVFVRVRMSLYVHVHVSMSHNATATTTLRLPPGICRADSRRERLEQEMSQPPTHRGGVCKMSRCVRRSACESGATATCGRWGRRHILCVGSEVTVTSDSAPDHLPRLRRAVVISARQYYDKHHLSLGGPTSS